MPFEHPRLVTVAGNALAALPRARSLRPLSLLSNCARETKCTNMGAGEPPLRPFGFGGTPAARHPVFRLAHAPALSPWVLLSCACLCSGMSTEEIDNAVQEAKRDMFSMRIKFAKREVGAAAASASSPWQGPPLVDWFFRAFAVLAMLSCILRIDTALADVGCAGMRPLNLSILRALGPCGMTQTTL